VAVLNRALHDGGPRVERRLRPTVRGGFPSHVYPKSMRVWLPRTAGAFKSHVRRGGRNRPTARCRVAGTDLHQGRPRSKTGSPRKGAVCRDWRDHVDSGAKPASTRPQRNRARLHAFPFVAGFTPRTVMTQPATRVPRVWSATFRPWNSPLVSIESSSMVAEDTFQHHQLLAPKRTSKQACKPSKCWSMGAGPDNKTNRARRVRNPRG